MMKEDIEIAREAHLQPIEEISAKLNIPIESLELFGKYKAKINIRYCLDCKKTEGRGKLILVSAISPTPAGEGKTTVSIGLTDALNKIGLKSSVVLREPSLGPVFGIKGGATGGGFSQCAPMEDINLHFTGDMHAITSAHNTLSALLNNAIYRHKVEMDPKKILWNRVMDVNDRSLRHIIVGLGKSTDGVSHETSFDITAASEIMAILCLSNNILDLKEKIGNILLGFNFSDEPIYCKDINVEGAITALLKDALKPNLVQTLENNPAFIHGGPFANIAQGTNSILATQVSLRTSDITVTEAGFGSDLGAEKFFDLVCPYGGFTPDLMVIVATIRALKMHGGQSLGRIQQENLESLEKGLDNLGRHLDNTKKYGMNAVVAINKFSSDSDSEINLVKDYCKSKGFKAIITNIWAKGIDGGIELAEAVEEVLKTNNTSYHPLYDWDLPVEEKIRVVAQEIYGADDIEIMDEAINDLKTIKKLKLSKLPICIAKTQKSFSDDPNKLGAPSGFILKVRKILIASGAGFLIPLTGEVLRMPGLPPKPAAESIDVDHEGDITGLF